VSESSFRFRETYNRSIIQEVENTSLYNFGKERNKLLRDSGLQGPYLCLYGDIQLQHKAEAILAESKGDDSGPKTYRQAARVTLPNCVETKIMVTADTSGRAALLGDARLDSSRPWD